MYLNKLDRIWAARCSQLGILVRYADDFVALCRTESQAREALRRIGLVMNRLGLKLHPAKTRLVDVRRVKESFVFLGCTIRKKRSIRRQIIAELTPVLRGWGNYFRTVQQNGPLCGQESASLAVPARRATPTQRQPFTGDQLYGMGLHELMGTAKYPSQATPQKIIVKPCAGKRHARFERGFDGNGPPSIGGTAP